MTLPSGTRLGPYEVVSLLGRGGMGEVYRALDTRLDRVVAIKVLPEALSGDERYRERLEREAKTISQLQHPHVCSLFDVGSSDEAPFFLVMEHLEGETLAERLEGGPLPVAEVLRIGREIAEAIEAAHRRGVVHRDLKPGNVMLTEHGTKVLDFGLAKGFASGDVETGAFAATVTAAGSDSTMAGTVPYMAPEQLEGKPADARTDLWALGCVLYEMVTGERPFRGDTQASLIGSIMQSQPEPLSQRQPVSPERLEWLVSRCLEKDPERRAQSARDISIELDEIADGQDGATAQPVRVFSGSTLGSRRSLLLVGLLVVAVLGVWGFLRWGRVSLGGDLERLVVGYKMTALPFENVADDPRLAPLALGIWDELLIRMGNERAAADREELLELARSEPCEAAQQLDSRWVFTGSVRRTGDSARVNVEYWDCPDRKLIWSKTYDREMAGLIEAQAEVATDILATSDQAGDASRYSGIPGSVGWLIGRRTLEANREAVRLLRSGIERWTTSTQLRNQLLMAHLQAVREGWPDSFEDIGEEMRQLSDEYCVLEPRGSGCQFMLAFSNLYSGDGQAAITAYKALRDLGPAPDAHGWLGRALAMAGAAEEAMASLEKARRISPEDADLSDWWGFESIAHLATGDYRAGEASARRCTEANTNNVFNVLGVCHRYAAAHSAHLGRLGDAKADLEKALALTPGLTLSGAAMSFASATPNLLDRYLEGLRLAGLGEDGLVDEAEWRKQVGAGDGAVDPIAALIGNAMPGGRAIVSFANPGGDADLDDLALAIQENIIALELPTGTQLQVLDLEEIDEGDLCGSAPGFRWLLGGGVRRLQGEVRVDARLTRCPEGGVRWSDSWTFTHDDLSSIADEAASGVVDRTQMVFVEDPDEPGSVRWYIRQNSRESAQEVLRRVEAAAALYPDEAERLFIALLEIHLHILSEGFGDPASENVAALERLAAAGVTADRQNFLPHLLAGYAALYKGDSEVMLRSFERAVALSGSPVAHANLGLAFATVGRPDEALGHLAIAIMKSPENPQLVTWLAYRSRAYFAASDYEDARSAALAAIDLNENTLFNGKAQAYQMLAASEAQLGREEEAKAALAEARRLRPALDEVGALASFATAGPDLRGRYLDALRLAGL